MKAFISALLGYDPDQKDLEGGILGVVKAYYGCVEAQGRGTLHCHMLVWVEGGLNPNEIKRRVLGKDQSDVDFGRRLLAFLDDTISNSIPEDPDKNLAVPSNEHHPCSVRGMPADEDSFPPEHQKDLRNVVLQCQSHTHSGTCFKYWRGPPEPKTCRFDLHEDNFRAESSFDPETGEIHLRCLDGLVNNFNASMIGALRNNMDMKFIGSGASAKGILYYITDYITKSQLKTHVAFAMLELAVKKLGEYNPQEDDLTTRAKKLLQKCAYAMISQQELSAQQVSSYLLDLEDHFTSHSYRNFYWTSFESFINKEDPSPECYQLKTKVSPPENVDDKLTAGQDCENDSQGQCDSDSEDEDDSHSPFLHDLLEAPSSDETTGTDDAEEEEIRVSIDGSGKLVAMGTQLADYQLRGSELDQVCVWDFISRVDRVSKSSDRRKHRSTTQNEWTASVEATYLFDEDAEDDGLGDEQDEESVLMSSAYKRPRVPLLKGHDQEKTHILRVRSPHDALVPVPIGPGIPRRDKTEAYARYCRLMLIFFKPWRHAKDLRKQGQSWEEAFDLFACDCPVKFKMDNMQILHECRDSRDDHFAERRYLARRAVKDKNIRRRGGREDIDDFCGEDVTEEMILDHLEEITDLFSMKKAASHEAILECIHYAENAGLYDVQNNVNEHRAQPNDTQLVTDSFLEDMWDKAYEDRREAWKKKAVIETPKADPPIDDDRQSPLVNDGSAFRNAFTLTNQVPEIRQDVLASEPAHDVDIEAHVEKWTLNKEQARAFRIIAHHSLQSRPAQLRMLLTGPGGTGKSRVIDALRDFFELRGQSRRLRLAAYTGVAARNINGMTLHAALCLNQRSSGTSQTKTRRDLTAMWEGVDYLFVDEVSMVGCSLLLQVSQALIEAKGNTALCGGVNVIFAGDSAQLPPVGMKSLYPKIGTDKESSSGKKGQQNILGKLLWLSIRTVVTLTRVERVQRRRNELTGELDNDDPDAIRFLELLTRLRQGKCTDADFDLLNSRLVTNLRPDWNRPELQNVPIIVSQNELKDALNEKAARVYAARTGNELHWYHASDVRSDGTLIKDGRLREHLLYKLHSGETSYRLGRLPLAIGMPVMVSQNFDVLNGIVNGSMGIVKQIRYCVGESGERFLKSCVVYIPDMTGPDLPNLPPKHAAILAETVNMTFVYPDSGRKCLIKRTQVPLVPAFAMTAHKAQGKTMKSVIMDLESTSGTEAPYVMLSRATSLAGVHILRPFQKRVIQRHPSQDIREEFQRLDMLTHQTIMLHGTAEEASEAQKYLVDTFSSLALPCPDNGTEEEVWQDDARRLAAWQKANSRLIAGAPPQNDRRLSASNGHQPRIDAMQRPNSTRKRRPIFNADGLCSSRSKRQRISLV